MKGAIAEDSTKTASMPAPSKSTITGMNHHDFTLKKAKSSPMVLTLFTNLRKFVLLAGDPQARQTRNSSLDQQTPIADH